jgi:hypothetical protein
LPNGATKDENEDTVYAVEINRQLAKLFANDLGAINWEVRQRLFKKPLALWWQFYSSKFTKPVAVAEVHRLSGSGAPLKEFRRKLGIAMKAVEAAGGAPAYIDKSTDTAVLVPKQRATIESDSPTLKELKDLTHPPVSDMARRQFLQSYAGADVERCLADWRGWLVKTGKTAEKPDRAFLGFAKRWATGSNGAGRR